MFGSWLGCGWSGLGPVFGSWLDRWAGIGWWWVWNSGSVDRWVDRLGWSSVAPMVALVMIFFNGFAPVGFKSVGFQIGVMGWWVFGAVAVVVDGLINNVGFWSVAWVFGAVAMVVDGLCVARGWGRRRGKKKFVGKPRKYESEKNDSYKEIIKKY